MVGGAWSVVGVTVVGGRWSVVGGWSVGGGFVLRCLRSVALKVEDAALIWMLTSAKNKKSL